MELTRLEIMTCLLGLTEYCENNPGNDPEPRAVKAARAKLRAEYSRLGTDDTKDAYF